MSEWQFSFKNIRKTETLNASMNVIANESSIDQIWFPLLLEMELHLANWLWKWTSYFEKWKRNNFAYTAIRSKLQAHGHLLRMILCSCRISGLVFPKGVGRLQARTQDMICMLNTHRWRSRLFSLGEWMEGNVVSLLSNCLVWNLLCNSGCPWTPSWSLCLGLPSVETALPCPTEGLPLEAWLSSYTH